jgi:hypothetical protein
MPTNGRWDLIRRLKVKIRRVRQKQYNFMGHFVIKVKVKSKVVRVDAIKACRRSRGITPLILNLGA